MTYYDRSGKEIAVLEWGALFENINYRLVKETMLDKYRIRTVWVGIDLDDLFYTGVFLTRSDQEEIHPNELVYAQGSISEGNALLCHDLCVAMYEDEEKGDG